MDSSDLVRAVPERASAEDPRTAQLEVLNDIARIATLDLELRPMLQRITDMLARRFDWQLVALTTIDHERDIFLCEALTTTLPTSVHVGYGRQLGSGVVGRVAAEGEPLLIDDVRLWPGYVETTPGALSELCVPVKHHGRLVAILNVESTRLGAFSGQLPLLTTVADQIAGAIASAQLYAELQQRARLMEMMSEVSRSALLARDLNALLVRIVEYIREHFPLEFVTILMHDEAGGHLEQSAAAGDVSSETLLWPITSGIVGRCLRTRTTQFVKSVKDDPDYIPANPRVTSEVAVPIRFGDEILGVLNLESASVDVFTSANIVAFEAFADQVAGAINMASVNARLAATKHELELQRKALEDANSLLANAIDTLHRISTQDGLTGISNRRHFDDTMLLEWRRALRKGSPLSLLMLDIDFFKAFNDAAGHQAGDDCLRRVAQTLQDSLHRASDLVARYGGEEFAILLPECDGDAARRLAETLRTKIEALRFDHPASETGFVTISIGAATQVPERGLKAEQLVSEADAALYEAKRRGRNRVV
jgi:diguanylate cyclase (GGDEF)-like protein